MKLAGAQLKDGVDSQTSLLPHPLTRFITVSQLQSYPNYTFNTNSAPVHFWDLFSLETLALY